MTVILDTELDDDEESREMLELSLKLLKNPTGRTPAVFYKEESSDYNNYLEE
jgi:hypothetical protein